MSEREPSPAPDTSPAPAATFLPTPDATSAPAASEREPSPAPDASPAPAATFLPTPDATPAPAATAPTTSHALASSPLASSMLGGSMERLCWGDIEDDDDEEDEDDGGNKGFSAAPSIDGSAALAAASLYHGKKPSGSFLEQGESSLGQSGCKSPCLAGKSSPAPAPLQAPPKLHSALVVPARHPSRRTPPARREVSPDWQEVKSRNRRGGSGFPPPSGKLWRRPSPSPGNATVPAAAAAYKEAFAGRCFRCLASDHRLAQCRDPIRCLACRRSGHLSKSCPQRALRRPVFSRLSKLPAIAHPPNIQSRLSFPPLSSPPAPSPAAMSYAPGMAHRRASQGSVVVVDSGAMTAERRKLRRCGVAITGVDGAYRPEPEEMQFALSHQLRIPRVNITVSKHKPEDFFARFDYANQSEIAIRAGSVEIRGTRFLLQPWREDVHTRPQSFHYHCKVFIERMPLHAWNEDGIKQLLGDVCSFDYIEPICFDQENTEVLQCWVWMRNPDLLPRSKLTTFFPEGAGRSIPGETAPPPAGGVGDLLIHLDRFFDWTPRPASTGFSVPDGRSFPGYKEFVWFPGVIDGRAPGGQSCRESAALRRDLHPDDEDDHREQRRLWADSFGSRECQAAGQRPTGQPMEGRGRSRSPPRGHHHVACWDGVDGLGAGRGRFPQRSSPAHSRIRDPPRRDDESWERRRSRSPSTGRRMGGDVEVLGACHGGQTASGSARLGQASQTVLLLEELEVALDAPPPPRTHPDPLMDYLASLCQEPGVRDSPCCGHVEDPMLFEFTSANVNLLHPLTFSPTGGPRCPGSPQYAPSSALWATASFAGTNGLGKDDGPGVQLGLPDGEAPLEQLTSQVHGMEIDEPEDFASSERDLFLDGVFHKIQPALSAASPPPVAARQVVQAPAQHTGRRQSSRLLARPSSVPVAHRATHRLIRTLDLAGAEEEVGDEAVEKYIKMYKQPIPSKTMAAMQALSRVANAPVMAACAALAGEALAAEVEST